MGYYSVKMVKKGDECYTLCEAGTMRRAAQLTEQSWGEGWRAVEVKPAQEFYQVLNAASEEEEAELLAQRVENLKQSRRRPVKTPDGEFDSILDAIQHYEIDRYRFMKLMEQKPDQYFYIDSR